MSRSQPAVRHGRRWLAPRVLGALAASAFVLLPAASGTAAPDDTSGTGTGEQEPNRDDMLTVAQEFGRSVDLGDHVLLRVTVTAGRLIDGEVRVTGSQSSLTVRQDVQVAGGSSEEVIVTVPVIDPGSASFEVELFDGDQSVDSDTVRFAFDAGTDVAGVMPVLAARAGEPPARVTLPGDLRRVDMVAVSLDVLDLGPSAISQLDTVLATSDDLVSLGPAARTTLLGWLDRGGHLVLDDTDDLERVARRLAAG